MFKKRTTLIFIAGFFVGLYITLFLIIAPGYDAGAITSLTSVVIASCALGLTYWQINQTEKHHRLSATPRLVSMSSTHRDNGITTIQVGIQNDGLGPALIQDAKIYIDDKPVEGKHTEPACDISIYLSGQYNSSGPRSWLNSTTVIAERERFILLQSEVYLGCAANNTRIELSHNQYNQFIIEQQERRKKVRFLIHYQSMYGDQFTLHETLSG